MWGRERAREVLAFLRRDVDAPPGCVPDGEEVALLSALYRSRDLYHSLCGSTAERRAYGKVADMYLRGATVDEIAAALGRGRWLVLSARARAFSYLYPAVARAADEGQAADAVVLALTPLGAAGASAARRLLASFSPIPGKGAAVLLARAALMAMGSLAQAACPHCGGAADPVEPPADGPYPCRCRYCNRIFKVLPAPRTKSIAKFRNLGRKAEVAAARAVCLGAVPDDGTLAYGCELVRKTLSLALREVCVRERRREGEGPLARHISPDCALEALDLVLAGAPEARRHRGGVARRFADMPLPPAEAVNAARSIVASRAREDGRFSEEEACEAACAMLGSFKGGADSTSSAVTGELAAFAAACIIPALEEAAGFGGNTIASLEAVERPCGMPAPKAEAEPKDEPNAEAAAEPKVEDEPKPKGEPKAEAKAQSKGEPEPKAQVKPRETAKSDGVTALSVYVEPVDLSLPPAEAAPRVRLVSRAIDPCRAASLLLAEGRAVTGCGPDEAADAVERLARFVDAFVGLKGGAAAGGSFRCYALLRMAGYGNALSMETAGVRPEVMGEWRRALSSVPAAEAADGREAGR